MVRQLQCMLRLAQAPPAWLRTHPGKPSLDLSLTGYAKARTQSRTLSKSVARTQLALGVAFQHRSASDVARCLSPVRMEPLVVGRRALDIALAIALAIVVCVAALTQLQADPQRRRRHRLCARVRHPRVLDGDVKTHRWALSPLLAASSPIVPSPAERLHPSTYACQ